MCYLSFSVSSLAPLICTMGSHTSPSSLFLAWSNPIHTDRPLPLTCPNSTYKHWLISMCREDLEVKTPETIITRNAGGLWLKSLSRPSALLWNLKMPLVIRVGNIDQIIVYRWVDRSFLNKRILLWYVYVMIVNEEKRFEDLGYCDEHSLNETIHWNLNEIIMSVLICDILFW